MELEAQGIQTPHRAIPGPVLAIAGDHEDEARRLCFQLRQAGLAVETDLRGRSLKAQMKYAGKSGARFVLVLGDDEADSGIGRLRNLETRAETEVRLDQLEHHLLEA